MTRDRHKECPEIVVTELTVWTKYHGENVESVDGSISDARGIVAKKKLSNLLMEINGNISDARLFVAEKKIS